MMAKAVVGAVEAGVSSIALRAGMNAIAPALFAVMNKATLP